MSGMLTDNLLSMGRFGETVRRLRQAARMSQDELAIAAKVSRATIQVVEKSDEPQMYGRNYKQLASALGLTPEQLDAEWKAETRVLVLPADLVGLIEARASAAGKVPAEWLRALVSVRSRRAPRVVIHDRPAAEAPEGGKRGR